MKKVMITGGAGFIGSHVVENYLKNNFSVSVIDNLSTGRLENLAKFENKIEFIKADISIPGTWQKKFENAAIVVHLAALADIVPSIQNPGKYYHSNVTGTFNVLQAAKTSDVKKFIYAASSSCYGIPDFFPTPETSEISPQYPYALTKRLGEELVLHWGSTYNLPVISLRFFNVYGPRSRTSGTYGAVFGVFLAQKLSNKPYTIVGDGTQTRDFTFVTDVADAILTAGESNISGEIYNVGSGKTISVNRIVELLDGPRVFIPKRPGEPDCTFADIQKIKQELKWRPRVPIEDGVQELLENIDYWSSAPVWDPNSIKLATKDWFKYLGD
jgi:UDP-glucose 4-epimerase